MATEEELEELMQQAAHAFEALLTLLCRDPVDVNGQVIPRDQATVDLIVTASARDKATLRNRGADNALRTLADLVGTTSGIAAVSIQIDD